MGEHIGQELVSAGLVSAEHLRAAIDYQKDIGGSLAKILVKLGHVDEEALLKHTARREGLEIVAGDDVKIDREIVVKLAREKLEQHEMVPLAHDATHVELGVTDPTDLDAVEDVRFLTGLEVKMKLISSKDARRALGAHFGRLEAGAGLRRPKTRPRGDVHEAARRAAGIPTVAEAARKVAEIEASPAKVVRGLAALLVEKGYITANELVERVRRLE